MLLWWQKRSIAWAKTQGQSDDCIGLQFIEEPRALVCSDGTPTKGEKSYTTTALTARYKTVVTNALPPQWIPQLIILEGMLLINVKPFSLRSMLEYAHFLLRRFVAPYYHKGSQEVHFLFDNPGRHSFSPKQWEQAKYDENSPVSAVHTHLTALRDDTLIPRNWSEFVHCRECKKGLTKYLAVRLLTVAPTVMTTPEQKFITAGPSKAILPILHFQ